MKASNLSTPYPTLAADMAEYTNVAKADKKYNVLRALIPAGVRSALQLAAGDTLDWIIAAKGNKTVARIYKLAPKAEARGETTTVVKAHTDPTDKGLRTSLPRGVRSALGLQDKDRLEWDIIAHGGKILVEVRKWEKE